MSRTPANAASPESVPGIDPQTGPAPVELRGSERRRQARHIVVRPVKMCRQSDGRYLSGHTCNLSAGGAMLEIDQAQLLTPGQKIRLGIQWSRTQTVLHQHDLIDAVVLRSLALGHTQHVALRFAQPQTLAMSA